MAAMRRFLSVLALVLLSGCAGRGSSDPCLAEFARADAVIAQAGVRDGEARRVPGHRHLVTDRFLASFAQADMAPDARLAWVGRLRAGDTAARTREAARLSVADHARLPEGLKACGDALAEAQARDNAAFDRLRRSVDVPSEYDDLARAAGAFPLSALALAATRPDDPVPVSQGRTRDFGLATPPAPDRAARLAALPRDALGIPVLDETSTRALLADFAPVFRVEGGQAPGMPVAGVPPDVDVSRPTLFGRIAFTRMGPDILIQPVYTLWFAGADGIPVQILWRTTLDRRGRPIVYDAIDGTGGNHRFSPVPPAIRQIVPEDADLRDEPVVAGVGPSPGPAERLVVRLAPGGIAVTAVGAEIPGDVGPLELAGFDQLAPLYAADGTVPGTGRPGAWWRWVTGLDARARIRAWGRHGTARIGQRHFDDPWLIQRVIQP